MDTTSNAERNDRSEAIREGKFLSVQSDASLKSTDGVHNAQERPFVMPEHDPEGSIAAPRSSTDTYAWGFSQPKSASSTYSEKTIRPSQKSESPSTSRGLGRKPTVRYNIETKFTERSQLSSNEPPPYTSPGRLPRRMSQSQAHLRRSRFSVIPSFYQAQEHFGVSRFSITPSLYVPGPYRETLTPAEKERFSALGPEAISPMHIVKLPDNWNVGLEPPDGGTLAWMQALAGFFVIMNAQGLNQSYGVFQAYYESVLLPHQTPSSIAWIGSIQIFLLFFMSIVVSTQMDKGRFQHCFTGGSIILIGCILATSWCTEYWHLVLAQGLGTGLGMGLIFGAGAQVLVTYFSKKLGIATGIASAGGSVGGMIFPAICEKLIFKIGFPWTVRVIALIVFVTMLPPNLIVRERPGRKPKGNPQLDLAMFKDIPYLIMISGLFFAFWGVYFGFYYIVAYAQQKLAFSASEAVNLLILMNATNLPGRFLPPLISDTCLGPLNTLIPTTFLTATLLFLFLGSASPASLTILAAFYGFAAAGIQSLYNATIWSFAGGRHVDPSAAGMRLAVGFAVIGLACLTGTPVGGALVGGKGGWVAGQVFAGGSVAVGGALMVGARWAREGWGSGRI